MALTACDPVEGNSVGFTPSPLTTPDDAFDLYDGDHSGRLDEDELFFALEHMGVAVSEMKQERLFKKYDSDGSGFIDKAEFRKLWLKVCNPRKELVDRGVDVPLIALRFSLAAQLGAVMADERQIEHRALAEAKRQRAWKERIAEKNKDIAPAKHRAQVELCTALDAAGQVRVVLSTCLPTTCWYRAASEN